MRRFATFLALAAVGLATVAVAVGAGPVANGSIAFMKVQDGRSEIAVVHPDGTASGGLTALGLNGEPAWSPDGRRLAYVCANFALCVMNADGSGQTALTDTGAWSGAYVFDEYPTWSPDGKRLAFQ